MERTYVYCNTYCMFLQNANIDDLIQFFISSLCNCTDFCIIVNVSSCLNVSLAIAKISLQGNKTLEIYNTLRALLQRTDLQIHDQESNYVLTCLSPWCNMTTDVMLTFLETSSESNCKTKMLIFCMVMALMLLSIFMAILIIYYYKTNQLSTKKQSSYFNATQEPTTKDAKQHNLALNNLKQVV